MCPTRWSSRHDAVVSLCHHNYKDILKSLADISLTSTKADERIEASGLRKVIQTFIMLVVMQDKLLLSVNQVSQFLQRQNMNLFDAASMLEAAQTSIKNARGKFEDIKIEAVTLARTWVTDSKFKHKRINRKKKLFDELCEDERLTDAQQHFKTSVYYTCMDTVISQLTCWFEGIRTEAERFRCIHPTALLTDDDNKLHAQAQYLTMTYNQDLSADSSPAIVSFQKYLDV